MNIRLPSANTESARLTIKSFKPVKQKSLVSDSAKPLNAKQSASSKSLEERREYFNGRES